MTPDEFRRHGHALIDWIADYRAKLASGGVPAMAQVTPGWLKERLPRSAPESAESFESIRRDLDELILPALGGFQHPGYFAYFPTGGALATVLGDLVSTGLGQIGLNWASSPALTELEEVTLDWLRQLMGLADDWHGVMQDTASVSSLLALICARERVSGYAAARGGLQSQEAALMVYTSAQAHSSVEKAALLAGFGRENMRLISTDAEYAMEPRALEAAIEKDIAEGRKPCAIVATVGTTGTTAVDPVEAAASLARKHGLWLHVDAAMAGSAMILPEARWMWQGIAGADSLVVNPHKWLGVTFDCSAYYVRDPEHLIRVMSTNPSYLRTSADGQATNYRDWGIALGRRFRALKLWFLLREQGLSGLRKRLRRDLANAQWLKDQIEATDHWRLLAPVPLQTLCVRHEPPGFQGEALDKHTLGWCGRINASGAAWLTPSQLDGRWMVRVSIGAEATDREHVERLWSLMQSEVA
jgi:aromatic-L-amino-acid decarboxylase